MSGLFGNNIFTIAQKSLDFRTSRHDLLASNVANKDTPGYQAEDLVFRASLEKALQAEQPGPLKQTDSRHFDGRNTPPLDEVEAQRILSASPYPDFDGNTVDLQIAEVRHDSITTVTGTLPRTGSAGGHTY